MKYQYPFVTLIIAALLIAGCGPKAQDTGAAIVAIASATQTAAAAAPAVPSPTVPAATGVISGTVHLMSPGTPHMTVYAVDKSTGKWAFTETPASDGVSSFSLVVPPGAYQVFAFTDNNGATGYSENGWDLAVVAVAANQTVLGINVRPPSPNECGSMLSVPASPDNRFKALAGPTAACRATSEADSRQATAPPAPQAPAVLPIDTPVGFQSLYGLGGSFMLPSQFPEEAGTPALAPYILSTNSNDYDISLDYGPDCHGAGACHYGSLSGKKVASTQPESTPNFVFDAARAQKVTLAKNMQGYFVLGLCGASCDDSKVFWVYNGYQYMIGLKGASQKAVVDLVNAAIANSVH